MGKILRLSCAMGGGLSLGTFSAGALTEALKSAIIHAYLHKDPLGKRAYSDVVLDSGFGASAGAITIGLIIRALTDRTDREAEDADQDLREQYTDRLDVLSMRKDSEGKPFWEKLVAVQHAQNLQKKVWTEKTQVKYLLSASDGDSEEVSQSDNPLKYKPSVFNRTVQEDIAREVLKLNQEGQNFIRRELLAPRVVFGCTLSALIPFELDEQPVGAEAVPDEEIRLGLRDASRQRIHQDYRIFDLFFDGDAESASYALTPDEPRVASEQDKESNAFPGRWFRYREGIKIKGVNGDLRTQKAWATFSATAIASGTFPIAFEPVNLRRSRWEYPDELWEKTFGDREKAVIPYGDGGMMENEPLREAFRVANFLDSLAAPEENIERWVLFVDPFVNTEERSLNASFLKTHHAVKINYAFGALKRTGILEKPSLNRMVPNAFSLLTALRNQTKVNEIQKSTEIRRKLRLRDDERKEILKKRAKNPAPDLVRDLRARCRKALEHTQKNSLIPSYTLSLVSEMLRVASEESESGHFSAFDRDYCETFAEADDSAIGNYPQQDLSSLWIMLELIYLDTAYGLTGKRTAAKPVVITPVIRKHDRAHIPLLGQTFSSFGGFMSQSIAEHDFNLGRKMGSLRIHEIAPGGRIPAFTCSASGLTEKMAGEIDQSRKQLSDRTKQIIRDHEGLPGLIDFAKWLASGLVGREIRNQEIGEIKQSIEIRVIVDSPEDIILPPSGSSASVHPTPMDYLDENALPDIHFISKPTLLTVAERKTNLFDSSIPQWSGPGLVELGFREYYVRVHNKKNKSTVNIPLPDEKQCREINNFINPVFIKKGKEPLTPWTLMEANQEAMADRIF